MALAQLTDEQTRTWTRAQKDEWWFKNVFRGDLPQLTWRSALTGFLMGGLLAATNLYVASKTGITLGVGLTSVILAFAMFRTLNKMGAKDFTILENNALQSICTAAGYMTTPLTSSLCAYMMVTGNIIPSTHMLIWMIIVSLLGVLVAFPLKRRFINEDQLPFPEGRAAGVLLDAIYTTDPNAGLFKARVLAIAGAIAGFYQFLCGEALQKLVQVKILHLSWSWVPWHFKDQFDNYYYALAKAYNWWIPKILGSDIRQLGIRFGWDFAMIGVGGLMGIRIASSVLLGALFNFVVLVPLMIQRGDIQPMVKLADGAMGFSRASIVNQWSLWWAVTMRVVGSLVALLGKPELYRGLFAKLGSRKEAAPAAARSDILNHIELPLWLSYVGVPILSVAGAWVTHIFFGVPFWLSLASLPLIFVLSIICTNAMALTSWTPTGALSKITQFTVGAIDRTNPASNLVTAGMTAEVAANAANLLSDIKPGYMLGAKPRQQALGHVIGIFSGAIAAVPLFFLLFLKPNAEGVRSVATLGLEPFTFPAAVQWKGVADLIAKGLSALPQSVIISMIGAALFAAFIELYGIIRKRHFPLSTVSIGLGVVLPVDASIGMFVGAFFFWWQSRRHTTPGTPGHKLWVDSVEPICAGLIAGAAMIGIADAIVSVLPFMEH